VPIWVNGYERSILELGSAGVQGTENNVADGRRQDVLGSDLEDARLTGLSVGQKRTEVKIVSELRSCSAGWRSP
jgi:hypothetical protein